MMMQSGVNDILVPWNVPRILRILDAADASREGNAGSDGRDSAAELGSLLRISNQLPDVAARVIAAPLFAQHPLVEGDGPFSLENNCAESFQSSTFTMAYRDVHHICTTALAVHQRSRAVHMPGGRETLAHDMEMPRNASDVAPYTAASELEEVLFAAGFSEPCLRGSFPDVASLVSCILPQDRALCSDLFCGDPQGASSQNAPNNLQEALHSLMSPPAVEPAAAQAERDASRNTLQQAPARSLRLHQTQPLSSAASQLSNSLLWERLPPASMIPVESRGPPGHSLFRSDCLVHSFTTEENAQALSWLSMQPLPLQLLSKADVEACRRNAAHEQQQATSSSARSTRPLGGCSCGHDGAAGETVKGLKSLPHCILKAGGIGDLSDDDGWSASSGWSNRSRSLGARDADSDGADAEDGLLESDGAKEEESERQIFPEEPRALALQLEKTSAPARTAAAAPTGTWVDDDGELVFENGRVTIRKKRMRPAKKMPPPLPLPTMVHGPRPNHPPTASNTAPFLIAEPSQVAAGGSHYILSMERKTDGEAASGGPSTSELIPGLKRCRSELSSDLSLTRSMSTPPPLKTAEAEETECLKHLSARIQKKEEASTVPIDVKTASHFSQQDIRAFIQSLHISETLRSALMIGANAALCSDTAPNSTAISSTKASNKTEAAEQP